MQGFFSLCHMFEALRPGRSAYILWVAPSWLWRLYQRLSRTESCLHVYLPSSSAVGQPDRMWAVVEWCCVHRGQAGDTRSRHRWRFIGLIIINVTHISMFRSYSFNFERNVAKRGRNMERRGERNIAEPKFELKSFRPSSGIFYGRGRI